MSALGSWSPPVALGSDVAISPLLSDLQQGNNSAANKTVHVSRAARSDRNTYLNKYSQFNGYRAGFDQKMILSTRSDLFPKESWVGCESDAQFGEKCARRTSNSHIRINSFGDNVMPLWVHSFWR